MSKTEIRIEIRDHGASLQARLVGHSKFPAEGLLIGSISRVLAIADQVLWNDFRVMLFGVIERVAEKLCGEPVAVKWDLPNDLKALDDEPGPGSST